MSEHSTQTHLDDAKLPPPTRAQRLAAFGFLGAFGLTIVTVLLTGLSVGAPNVRHVLQPAPPATETRSPDAQSGTSSLGSSRAAPSALPGVSEPRTNEDAGREDAERDPDGAPRKHVRKDASDSRANDAR
jgi:hypothetical protein